MPNAAPIEFPFKMSLNGPQGCSREQLVRQRIVQTLFTEPGERIFRADFGGGARRLVFEPNQQGLWQVTERRVAAALVEALAGEADPSTLSVRVTGANDRLEIRVQYRLARVNLDQSHTFIVVPGGTLGTPA